MPQSYLSHLHHFLIFLTAYIHTLLALRDLYPRATFLTARFHNTPIFQSRHPTLCTWITDAVSAVRTELLAGTVARIAVVIYHLPPSSPSGATKVLERHLIDVSRFPTVPKQDWETDIVFAPAEPAPAPAPAPAPDQTKEKTKTKPKPLDADTPVDLAEQFRAALIQLTTRCGRLAPLPPHCSFSLALELKDDADPPVGHPQPWIPVQPSLQKTRGTEAGSAASGSAGAETDENGRSNSASTSSGPAEGADLGGARTTPIRAVEAGVLRFEMWVEEGKAKFEMQAQGSGSVESSGG